jgi:hypothetical protein
MIEALACGTPVLSYKEGSAPEMIDHEVTGFLVDDTDHLVAHCDASTRSTGTPAARRSRSASRPSGWSRQHLRLFERILAERGGRQQVMTIDATRVRGRHTRADNRRGSDADPGPHVLPVERSRGHLARPSPRPVLPRLAGHVALRGAVNGAPLESLAVEQTAPFAATFIARAHPFPGHADAHLVVRRERAIGRGMRERLSIVNHGLDPHDVTIELFCAVDFAHVFAVKQGSVDRPSTGGEPIDIAGLEFVRTGDGRDDTMTLTFDRPGTVQRGLVAWHLHLAPGERWEVCARSSSPAADARSSRSSVAGRQTTTPRR